jgi:hypothetical protein
MSKEITRQEFRDIKDGLDKLGFKILPFYYTEQTSDEVNNPEFRHYTSVAKGIVGTKMNFRVGKIAVLWHKSGDRIIASLGNITEHLGDQKEFQIWGDSDESYNCFKVDWFIKVKDLGPLKLSSNGRPDFTNSECVFQIWNKLQNEEELIIV